MLKLYTDGATKGNPGPAGIGISGFSGLPRAILQHHAALACDEDNSTKPSLLPPSPGLNC